MTKLALYFLLPIAFVLGQTVAPPAAAEAKKTATIEGTVINETTKEPLRRAEIKLARAMSGPEMIANNSALSAVTDAEGKFRIENIEPGEYFLNHRKAGYVGSLAIFGYSEPMLKLSAGQALTDLRYALLPQAIVTGRVLDDEGEPVQGASVMLQRSHFYQGAARMFQGGQALTNDRGEYRIADVRPGKYCIQVDLHPMMPGSGSLPVPSSTAGAPRTEFVSTYYPSAIDMAHATRIEARAGLELSGQDVVLRKEKLVKVSGKVIDSDGSPAKNILINLLEGEGFWGYSNTSGMVDENGGFSFSNVLPGQYTIAASNMNGPSRQTTRLGVTLGDFDVTNVVVHIQPALEAKGSIVLEGSQERNFDFTGYRLSLTGGNATPFGGAYAEVSADGTLKITSLASGHYMLDVYSVPRGYVQSIQVGPEDALGKEVDAAALAAGGVRIVVRLDPASVKGTVEIPEERLAGLSSPAVVLVPTNPRLRTQGLVKVTELRFTKGFEFSGVRPGDYFVFAFENFERMAFEDPEVFAAVESQATKVTLGRGESKDLTLKILPWPAQFADRLQ